ncbi:glycoside hydrolase family 9 protein [Phanerochaete carnosa HHB-10118-sp]|uniref:cellulase n=1 Tax=Phanerochaete carnosa (strain HHB-10118-sp) TaxID=650164 RepID=K5WJW3_PHACS|nr:glycoside hydrolase family 9 protein [Phanerochaete carnosa HHB-10118-sp]EKM59419.1 glycoside hydrolase family 9 protein [Phanerochaete carnosa HHB-10118-sp]
MRLCSSISAILLLASLSTAQLSLPNPPWLPPNATFGAKPGNISDDSVNPHWTNILGSTLYFYEEQRSGKLPGTNRVPWRNDSAIDDGSDVGLDLSGGYYDAGDYIKYTFPMSFSVMSICWGALDFGRGYDLANQTAYLDDMLRWSLDWLMKAHPTPNTLYVQIGDADLDNAYWGGDRGIPTPRPSYAINSTSPGTDAAAQAAAAFAACSALYNNQTLSQSAPASIVNTSYALTLLQHAQQLYDFATNSSISQVTYQTSVPSVADAYPSSGFSDELAIAALFLSLASNSSDAYSQACQIYEKQDLAGHLQGDAVFNWDEKSPGVAVLGVQIARTYPLIANGSDVDWTSDVESYFDRIVNGTGRAFLTPGGLLYYPGDSDDATLNPALNAAMLLMRYADSGLASDSEKQSSYRHFTQSQIDYFLGNNPMTMPYIVGVHPNAPSNPHSALATGASPQDIANIDTVPEHEAYVLYGGAVGGPNGEDQFWDLRGDWVESEVGLDYVAPVVTIAARALVNGTGDPWYTQLQIGSYNGRRPKGEPCDAAVTTGCPSHSWRVGKIVMGVLVGVTGLVIMSLGTVWILLVCRNCNRKV